MAYTNQTTVENWLKRSLTAHESAVLAMLIAAAEKVIDTMTNRSFGAAASGTRLYDGNGERELWIDPFTAITRVDYVDGDGDVLSALTVNDDYVSRPQNGEYIDSLVLVGGGRWSRGLNNIKVTGTAGNYAATPDAIKLAATRLVAGFIDKMGIPQTLQSESIEGYSYQLRNYANATDPELELILAPYKRILL